MGIETQVAGIKARISHIEREMRVTRAQQAVQEIDEAQAARILDILGKALSDYQKAQHIFEGVLAKRAERARQKTAQDRELEVMAGGVPNAHD